MCDHHPTHRHLQLFLRPGGLTAQRQRPVTLDARRSLLPPLLLALLLAGPMADSQAQTSWSGSVTAQSDYRIRGQTLSDGKAATQLNLNLDGAAGWYLGGLASTVHVGERDGAQLLGYAGYARRGGEGWSWEAGCTRSHYSRLRSADYGECYGGLSTERLNARLYYAPRYLGRDARTVYGEVNAVYPLAARVNLVAHAGLLHTLSGAPWPGIPTGSRYDGRLGVAIGAGDWTVQLARIISESESLPYQHDEQRAPRAWTVSASYSF